MIHGMIDRFDALAARYRKPLAVLGAIWLGVSWASSAGFVPLPEIPLLTGKSGVFASTAFAALWWAMVNPRVQKRRASRPEENAALGESK